MAMNRLPAVSRKLEEHARELRAIATCGATLTEGERLLIAKAADSVAAAYRIISTGDPNA